MHKKILLLSLPLVLSNIIIPLSGIVNTGLIGHLYSSDYLAATSLGVAIVNFIIFLFFFFRMSATGIFAHLYAQHDYQNMAKWLARAFVLVIFFAVVILALKDFFLEIAVFILGANVNVIKLLSSYYHIVIFSVPFIFISYVSIGFLIAVQKVRNIFMISLINCSAVIIFSSVFVLVLQLDIVGIAYSTLISQAITSLCYLVMVYLFISRNLKLNFLSYFLHKNIWSISSYKTYLSVNSNIFIRSLCLLVSLNSFYIFSSYYGEQTLAANSILLEVATFVAMFLDAIANTTETLVGEAYIDKSKNLKDILHKTLSQTVCVALIFCIIYAVFFSHILSLLTSLADVKKLAHKYALFSILFPFIASFSYWIDGVFVGMLKTAEMRNTMILSTCIYCVLLALFLPLFGNYGLWFCFLCFFALRFMTMFWVLKRIKE